MARARWTKDDSRTAMRLAGIFAAVGAGFGLLSGDGIVLGAIAGVLMLAIALGVGALGGWR